MAIKPQFPINDQHRKLSSKHWLVQILFPAFIILSLLTGFVAYRAYKGLAITPVPPSPGQNDLLVGSSTSIVPTPTPFQPEKPANAALSATQETSNLVTLQQPALATPFPKPKLKLIGGGHRINILVMGLDYRDYLAGDIPRSDTMVLITIDPDAKTAGMLSIPRDMWVDIPGYGEAKINTAYFLGEADELPGGGPGLAVKTVEQFLSIPINYYAVVDFNAFTDFIDQIGGITLDIPEDIQVTPIGPGHSIVLKAGVQHMFGADALAYARNRYTALGDFDRASRQQQVILAVRDRVLKATVWPSLILNAPALYRDLSGGFQTNLSFNQLIQLALLARQIPEDHIKHAIIGPDMVTFSKSDNGEDILIPNMAAIEGLRDQVFSNTVPRNSVVNGNR